MMSRYQQFALRALPHRAAVPGHILRFYATTPEGAGQVRKRTKKVSSAELRKQRNKLAVSSLKDIFESFMPSSSGDDEVFDIDPKPIYADPRKYHTLSQPLQQCVLDDLQKQLKKKWTTVPADVKRFHFLLCYDNHGPRESFPSKDYVEAPLDLPFKAHHIKTARPGPKTKVHRLDDFVVNLNALGPKRKQQAAKDAMMDPISKSVLFLVVLLTLLNFRRDSRVQSSAKVPVNRYEESLVERARLEEAQRQEAERQAAAEAKHTAEGTGQGATAKKWYYLWLK